MKNIKKSLRSFGKNSSFWCALISAVFLAAAGFMILPAAARAQESVEVKIPMELKLEGETPSFTKEYSFLIKADENSAPSPENAELKFTEAGEGSFGPISISKEGTYSYTIEQTTENTAGFTLDTTVYHVTIYAVTDDDDNILTSMVLSKDDGEETAEEKPEAVVYTNSYEQVPGKIVLSATKELTGRDLKADEFSFLLTDSEGEELQTAKNTESGTITFDAISYTAADIEKSPITYKVSEVKGADEDIDYDESSYEIKVTLSRNSDGTITAEADVTGEEIVFKNQCLKEEEPGDPNEGPGDDESEESSEASKPNSPNTKTKTGKGTRTGDTPYTTYFVLAIIAALMIAAIIAARAKKASKEQVDRQNS